MEPSAMGQMDEDLNVMARILQKTVEQEVKSSPVKKLGLVLQSMGKDRSQGLYLEEYGALFLLQVRLLLLPPPAPKDTAAEDKPPVSPTWEQTREELYGAGRAAAGRSVRSESDAEYDEALVTQLKQKLLAALKNASHIRHLKSDEFINITLLGDPTDTGSLQPRASGRYGGGFDGGGGGYGGFGAFGWGGVAEGQQFEFNQSQDVLKELGGQMGFRPRLGSSTGTTLTIRVKKADVDALAASKLTSDEFQKRAAVHTYVGNAANVPPAEWFIHQF
jgi:hypothetical protein